MEMTLTKEQRLIANAAAGVKENRPVLECLHFKGGIIEACDGHLLLRTNTNNPGADEMLLSASAIATMKSKRDVITFTNGNGEKVTAIGDNEVVLTKQSGQYVNTDQLFPTDAPVFEVGIGIDVLAKLAKCIGKGKFIKFTFTHPGSAIKLEVMGDENNTKGVMMPCRIF